MKQTVAPIISSQIIMSNCYLTWLESPEIAAEARPGQFVMVRCGEDTLLRRPLSIHRCEGEKIALLFQVVGRGTAWLSQLQAGDSVDLLGPLGNGFSIQPAGKNLLLAAGGIGIAPLCFLAQQATGHRITLLLGASTAARLYPGRLLPPRVNLVTATEDGTAGKKCLVSELLQEFAGKSDQIFACGPPGMYRTMAGMPELRDKPVQVSLEIMMGCGVGVCYGCTLRTRQGLRQVCQDGPVFALKDILRDSL